MNLSPMNKYLYYFYKLITYYKSEIQLANSINNILDLLIQSSLKMVDNLGHRDSDITYFKLDVTDFVLEPVHIVFFKSEPLAFQRALVWRLLDMLSL